MDNKVDMNNKIDDEIDMKSKIDDSSKNDDSNKIDKSNRVDNALYYVAVISVIVLLVALVPMMWLGRYNHALGDDFYYGLNAKQALDSSGIVGALKAAAEGTKTQYNIWQGTYSAMYLMYLPPQIFGDFFYKLYPAVLIGMLVIGVFSLLHPIVVKIMKAPAKEWVIISSVISFMCVEMVPSMGEAFYWYNGSMYYTGFFVLTLIFFGMLINYVIDGDWVRLIPLCVIAALIAGANYASLIPAMILMVLLFVGLVIKRASAGRLIGTALVFVVTMIGFVISVKAPGNALRQATSYGTTPVKAILKSLYQAFNYLRGWNNVWMYAALLLLTPLFIIMVKRVTYGFKLPLLFIVLGFGIWASASCPTFYAQNNGGAARVFDLSWYMLVLYVYASWFYLVGWAVKRIRVKEKYIYIGAPVTFLVLYAILTILYLPGKPQVNLNSVQVAKAITSGDAKYYEEQYQERVKLIESDEQNLVFKVYDVPDSLMYVLWVGDLSQDSSEDNNIAFAKFYKKESARTTSE